MGSAGETAIKSNEPIILPFLKWAGGKRWLAKNERRFFPTKFNRYIEPFVGSAAVFFSLAPKKAVLSDLNGRLINTYEEVRDRPDLVLRYLRGFAAKHSTTEYYRQRSISPRSKSKAAAQFIYLNRVCFNGIYRVNLKGEFNVPIGTKTSVLLDTDDFFATSQALAGTILRSGDFEKTVDDAKRDDFLYIDPPYTTKHNLNGFVKYNEHIFRWDDQIRLAAAVRRAHQRGVKIVVSNAFHASVKRLYAEFLDLHEVQRPNVIASQSNKRGITSELIATNV